MTTERKQLRESALLHQVSNSLKNSSGMSRNWLKKKGSSSEILSADSQFSFGGDLPAFLLSCLEFPIFHFKHVLPTVR